MSWIIRVIVVVLSYHGSQAENCNPEDLTLTLGNSSLGSGHMNLRCRRDDEFSDVYFGFFSFTRISGASDTIPVFANISFTCLTDERNMVLSDFSDDVSDRLPAFFSSSLYQSALTGGLTCNFTGCYKVKNDKNSFLLDIEDCYVDFDECSNNNFNDCAESATCTNDEMGTYQCDCHEGYFGSGSYCEEEVLPELEHISRNIAVKNGSSATFHCTSLSAISSSIAWRTFIPGVILPQPTVIQDGNTTTSSITLESLNDSYSGDYFCNVSNRFGEVVESTLLSVIYIAEPEEVIITTGNTAHLTCDAWGSPDLTYTWLNLPQHYYVDGNALTIPNVGRIDEKDYICSVSLNGTNVGECEVSLRTQGPEIIEHPLSFNITVPANFTLNCTATNNDDAHNNLTFYWLKNEVPLENEFMTTTTSVDSNMTSHLWVTYDVLTHHSDTFHCIATNREIADGTKSLPSYVTLQQPSLENFAHAAYNSTASDTSKVSESMISYCALLLLLLLLLLPLLCYTRHHMRKAERYQEKVLQDYCMDHESDYMNDFEMTLVDVNLSGSKPEPETDSVFDICNDFLYPEQELDYDARTSADITTPNNPTSLHGVTPQEYLRSIDSYRSRHSRSISAPPMISSEGEILPQKISHCISCTELRNFSLLSQPSISAGAPSTISHASKSCQLFQPAESLRSSPPPTASEITPKPCSSAPTLVSYSHSGNSECKVCFDFSGDSIENHSHYEFSTGNSFCWDLPTSSLNG